MPKKSQEACHRLRGRGQEEAKKISRGKQCVVSVHDRGINGERLRSCKAGQEDAVHVRKRAPRSARQLHSDIQYVRTASHSVFKRPRLRIAVRPLVVMEMPLWE